MKNKNHYTYIYIYIYTRTPRALKRALRSILSKFLTYPISSCVRSLLIASTMMMMMMMTMTGMETPIQKRLYGWRNGSQRRRYKHAGAASVVLKSSKIKPRGALGCRLSASRVQGRSCGSHRLNFWHHLVDFESHFGAYWILKGSPN